MVVLGLDVGDVKEAVAADREIDERGLNGRFEVDDLAFINIAGIALVAGPFDVQLLQDAVFDDGDPALLGLEHVDEHFFLHAVVFLAESGGDKRVKGPWSSGAGSVSGGRRGARSGLAPRDSPPSAPPRVGGQGPTRFKEPAPFRNG